MSTVTKSHYHGPSRSILEIGTCKWCRSTVQVGSPEPVDAKPDGMLIWGEVTTPARALSIEVDGEERECCENCGGVKYYVETIKNDHTIVARPLEDVVQFYNSRKTAEKECAALNLKDNPPPTLDEGDVLDLTSSDESTKLSNPIVIKLVSALDANHPRGSHIEVEAAEFIEFLKQTGAKSMATKKTAAGSAKELIRSLIQKKKSDAAIITEVVKAFPDSQVDSKHCTKYRRELFVEEAIGPELAAANSRDHREWALANMAQAKRGPHGDHWKAYDAKQKEAEKAKKEAAKAKKAPAKKAPAKKPATKKTPAKKAPAKAAG